MKGPRFVIDFDAVRHNVAAWRGILGDRELWAVVKSNGYGTGAVDLARASLAAGAARLVVFDIAEARALRDAGVRAPIVQVFAARDDDLATAVALGVAPTIEDEAGARTLSVLGDWRGRKIPVHVAIDTGTGWSGVPAVRAGEFGRAVKALPGIAWEGAWTHIAGAASMDAQMRAFATAVAALRAGGIAVPAIHVASTGPVLWGKATGAARIGIGLFGSKLEAADAKIDLRNAVTVSADVVAVKTFDAATPLGYGGEEVAQAGDAIATARIGYADGLPRTLGNGAGAMVIGSVRCPTAGAIGMNTTMLRLPSRDVARIGDEAIALGDAPGVRLDEVAAAAGLIPHAVLVGFANGIAVKSTGAPA